MFTICSDVYNAVTTICIENIIFSYSQLRPPTEKKSDHSSFWHMYTYVNVQTVLCLIDDSNDCSAKCIIDIVFWRISTFLEDYLDIDYGVSGA